MAMHNEEVVPLSPDSLSSLPAPTHLDIDRLSLSSSDLRTERISHG